jgi:exopolyphosphatase/pppGpp-phosphohydrolase
VIPYPIEIISGNEEARLIFMGVEHTQPERGRKLVIDIGGGSTELVIGEDFEPRLVESRRMGCVSFSQAYFPGGVINKENFQRARLSAVQKLETWPGSSASRAGTSRWAHRAPLKPLTKCWWPWARKTGSSLPSASRCWSKSC